MIKRSWLTLHEKGGNQHETPVRAYIDEYLNVAGTAADQKSPLFRTVPRTQTN